MGKTGVVWVYWLIATLFIGGYLGYRLMSEDKTIFLPGNTSHGHYQIEMACSACHEEPFGGGPVLQDACMGCHAKELKNAHDSHPKSKFMDPRNADRVEKLDARRCISCHVEHKPEITSKMGLTVAEDICINCHLDIADDRPSHAGMEFDTCASAGCHNFHDNRALYEDFLLKHVNEADVLSPAKVKPRNFRHYIPSLDRYPVDKYPLQSLSLADKDVPDNINFDQKILQEWSSTAHSKSGVNCSACHMENAAWTNKPSFKSCETCHNLETEGFLAGKHGMRLKQGLSPMTPGMARITMKSTAHAKELSCASCHVSHQFDTRHAAVEACLACHDDDHSLSYKESAHYALWYQEQSGQPEKSTGVSCASCHMPRTIQSNSSAGRIVVQHNQNDNLRPNEKMLRTVCMNCHGLGFAIDALADEKLIKNNFTGRPGRHIKSIDMAERRVKNKRPQQVREDGE